MSPRFFYSFAFIVFLSGCSQHSSVSIPEMSQEEAEATLQERYARLSDRSSRTGLPAYDPLVPVEGSLNWQPLPRASEDERTIPQGAIRKIEQYAEKNNSAALMVWRDGLVEAEHYFGDTDPETLTNSKSLAKPLSVIAVGRAIAEGHIDSLDQPAADFIKEWRGTSKEKILIRHLLGMRSGLLPQAPAKSADDVLMRAYLHPFFEDVLINEYPMVNEPGVRYDYSNANAELIAPLIEASTGEQYEDWLADEVLKSIGARGGEIWMGRPGGMAHSGCCVLLPSEVYLRAAILILQEGIWEGRRLLPEGFVQEMVTPTEEHPHAGLGIYIGSPYIERRGAANPDVPFGKVLHSEPYLADDLVLFDGNSNQVAYIVPSEKLVILRTGDWAPREPEWDNAFIPNTILGSIHSDAGQIESQTEAEPESEAESRRFANAMNAYKPLSLIKGSDENRAGSADQDVITNPVADFSQAIEYARSMDSYSLLVWQGGQLLIEQYFEDFDADLRSDTASMHKSVLALLIAAAIEDGFIESADAPIGNYLEFWQGTPEGKISIRNLLQMSSGLKKLSDEGGVNSPRWRFFADSNARSVIQSMEAEVEPGSRFLYANTNSQILGMIIEAATGMAYADYLSERLWQRLGAKDAYVWNYEPDGFPRTYTALLARAKDWLRVGLMIKNRGEFNGDQIISAELMDQITASSDAYINYGWQIWLGREYEKQRFYNNTKTGPAFMSEEPFDANDMIYFDGIGGQRVYISREQDLVVIRTGDMRFDWDDSKLPNLVMRALK